MKKRLFFWTLSILIIIANLSLSGCTTGKVVNFEKGFTKQIEIPTQITEQEILEITGKEKTPSINLFL